jgi:hypothetical protein
LAEAIVYHAPVFVTVLAGICVVRIIEANRPAAVYAYSVGCWRVIVKLEP